MQSAVSVFGPSAFRLIHQPCFWPDAPRSSSRTPLKTLSTRSEAQDLEGTARLVAIGFEASALARTGVTILARLSTNAPSWKGPPR
jgi:hypothetical protein